MIQLRSRFSSRIIKKGDYFTIYVDIKNGYEKTINLKEVKISQPMGFNPVTIREQEEEQDTIIDKIWKRYNKSILGSWFNRYGMRETTPKDSSQRAGTTNHNKASESLQMPFLIRPTTEIIEGASIIHDKDEPIQPNGSYSEIFYLKAGWSGGLRPRPYIYNFL